MTHRDVFARLSARSVRCSDAEHRKRRGTQAENRAKPPCRLSTGTFGRASKGLTDTPHRLRPFSYPKAPVDNLYGALSTLLGISD